MYADDTQIYASSASFSELALKLNQDLENIVKLLSENNLQLHSEKTKVMFVGSPYRPLAVTSQLQLLSAMLEGKVKV